MASAHEVYLNIALTVLILDFVVFGFATRELFYNPKQILANPVMLSFYLLLPPNMIMMVVYFIEHLSEKIQGTSPEAGGLCGFVAFCAVTAIVWIMGGAITVAYASFKLIQNKEPGTKAILMVNAGFALVGLIFATIYAADDALGPYEDIYCCLKTEKYNGYLPVLAFCWFGMSILAQTIIYIRAYRLIEEAAQMKKQQTAGENSDGEVKIVRRSRILILKWGVEILAWFYVCWVVMGLTGLISAAGSSPPMWMNILAALAAKSFPSVHCALLLRNLHRYKTVTFPGGATVIGSSEAGQEGEAGGFFSALMPHHPSPHPSIPKHPNSSAVVEMEMADTNRAADQGADDGVPEQKTSGQEEDGDAEMGLPSGRSADLSIVTESLPPGDITTRPRMGSGENYYSAMSQNRNALRPRTPLARFPDKQDSFFEPSSSQEQEVYNDPEAPLVTVVTSPEGRPVIMFGSRTNSESDLEDASRPQSQGYVQDLRGRKTSGGRVRIISGRSSKISSGSEFPKEVRFVSLDGDKEKNM